MGHPRRIFLSGVSLHVIQRGNNRMCIFQRDVDYASFISLLRHQAGRHSVAIHGFTLMTNHYHLIVTPVDAAGLTKMMREIDGGYVRYYNRRYERIGTLWNGRYRALHIEDERYWLTCLRYVEQNPVRAGIVPGPDAYRWSSYAAHGLGRWPDWLTPHPVYLALGGTDTERQVAYRSLCRAPTPEDEMLLLR